MYYRYQSDTGYGRTTNTDLVLGSSSRTPWSLVAMQSFRINMAPTAMWPSHTNMTPGVILDPPEMMQYLMVSDASDPECRRLTDADMALVHNSGPEDTMTSVDNPGHPNCTGTSNRTSLRCQHGNRLWSRVGAFLWALVATSAISKDMNTDHICGRTTDTTHL